MTAPITHTRLSGLSLGLALALTLGTLATAGPEANDRKVWDFESDEPGKIARGFVGAVGRWAVVQDDGNRVLAQQARNDDATFNVALVEGTAFQDVDLSVRLRAVAGEVDRGGGLVWRTRDARNYYVCRYNPLEDNFRVYKVEDGKRTQFRSAMVPGDTRWHVLRVTMNGPKIACQLDGKTLLEVEDTTFPEAGMVGLWSKADAQSHFDSLTVEGKAG